MASIPPSTVDEGEGLQQRVGDVLAQPPTVESAGSRELVLYKGRKTSTAGWNPKHFYKDAEYFRLLHGLPNEGIAPHKITDVTDTEMTRVFGVSTKNGYKLSNVQGIPHEDILALGQVVDGYDKPVNGVLSHTFAKGVYVDFKQNKKVDWASYAALKLKGQVTQWCRDGKGKPEGPPCVRKPQQYVRPCIVVPGAADAQAVVSRAADALEQMAFKQIPDAILGEKQPDEDTWRLRSLEPVPVRSPHDARKNVLISIMESEARAMLNRLEAVKEKFDTVQNSVEKLKNYEVEYRSVEKTVEAEVESLRQEERALVAKIKVEDDAIADLTTDIELESNKLPDDTDGDGGVADQVNTELLQYMTENLEIHNANVQSFEMERKSVRQILLVALAELNRKEKERPDTPQTFARLSKVSAALAVERVKIEANLKAQDAELQIVSAIFSCLCPPVIIPCYIPTSTETISSSVDVSTCPICCNGYHCFNWMPASCGHTFHPACLFASINSCKGAPKCYACGEAFSNDWLQTWGIDRGEGNEGSEGTSLPGRHMFTAEMKNVYGENCGKLAQRRQWVKTLDKDFHLKAKRCASHVVLSSTIDALDGEGGSSRPASKELIVPKVEGDTKKRRATAEVETSKPAKTRRSHPRNTPTF